MRRKRGISPKTKKILTGIGIASGTVIVFFVSFFLAFNFIVNPITFTSVGNPEAEKENAELKAEVQSLQDEIDDLKADAKNGGGTPQTTPKEEPAEADTSDNDDSTTVETPKNSDSEKKDNKKDPETPKKDNEDKSSSSDKKNDKKEDEDFEPETTVTPEDGHDPEADVPIIVID